MDFNVFIEQDEDGIYVAKVPEIEGCYTQGETLEEVIERIKEGYLDDVKYGIWIEENSTVTSGFGPSAEFCPFSLD